MELTNNLQHASRCVFCGHDRIDIKSYLLRSWHVYCVGCEARGPIGKTPDEALYKWNTTISKTKTERETILEGQIDYQNPQTVSLIWKAIRMRRVFTINEIELLSDQCRKTVYNYTRLLKKCGFVREEHRKKAQGAPVVFRCIKPEIIEAPGWTELQVKMRQIDFPDKVRNLKKISLEATTN